MEDTHYIDRSTFTLTGGATRPAVFGPGWFVVWSMLIAAAAVGAAVWARSRRWVRARAILQRARTVSAEALAAVRNQVHATEAPNALSAETAILPAGSGGFWTMAATAVSAPLVIVLCITLWRTPFPSLKSLRSSKM